MSWSFWSPANGSSPWCQAKRNRQEKSEYWRKESDGKDATQLEKKIYAARRRSHLLQLESAEGELPCRQQQEGKRLTASLETWGSFLPASSVWHRLTAPHRCFRYFGRVWAAQSHHRGERSAGPGACYVFVHTHNWSSTDLVHVQEANEHLLWAQQDAELQGVFLGQRICHCRYATVCLYHQKKVPT